MKYIHLSRWRHFNADYDGIVVSVSTLHYSQLFDCPHRLLKRKQNMAFVTTFRTMFLRNANTDNWTTSDGPDSVSRWASLKGGGSKKASKNPLIGFTASSVGSASPGCWTSCWSPGGYVKGVVDAAIATQLFIDQNNPHPPKFLQHHWSG